jgi:SAM-dependent methyltransferase
LQREAVWRRIDPLFGPGDSLLDLGCGTGEDALHFMKAGVRVRAIDASSEMVRIARQRGVNAEHLPIAGETACATLHSSTRNMGGAGGFACHGLFDGVISNFGALNCVEKLDRPGLASLVRPGGYLAICVMGRFCLWETVWYLFHAEPRKAFRRWSRPAVSSFGIRIYYPSIRQLRESLLPDFDLIEWCGIGISVPPSYVSGLPEEMLKRLGRMDRHLGMLRSFSDHRLLIFRRK